MFVTGWDAMHQARGSNICVCVPEVQLMKIVITQIFSYDMQQHSWSLCRSGSIRNWNWLHFDGAIEIEYLAMGLSHYLSIFRPRNITRKRKGDRIYSSRIICGIANIVDTMTYSRPCQIHSHIAFNEFKTYTSIERFKRTQSTTCNDYNRELTGFRSGKCIC